MTVKATTLVLLTGVLMVLVGCSSAPSEADINTIVEAKLSALNIEATIHARVEDKLLLSKHQTLCKQEVRGWNPFNSTTKFRYGCT